MKRWLKPFFIFSVVSAINFNLAIFYSIASAGEIKWQSPKGPSCVVSIVIDPSNPSIIYAGTVKNGTIPGITCSGNGVYKSIDGGDNWISAMGDGTPTNSLPEDSLTYMITLAPTNPATLYAATATDANDGIFKSTDGGENWSPINTGLDIYSLDGRRIHSEPIIDPSNPSIIYIGTEDGIFKSTDNGDSWVSKNNGMPLTEILIRAIDPVDPLILYASPNYEEGYRDGGLYKTIDGGTNWLPVNNGIPDITTAESEVNAVAIGSTNHQIVYAGTNGGGVFKTTNGGVSWVNISLTNKSVYWIVIDPSNPAVLYVGTWGDGVFGSTDGGEKWSTAGLLDSIVRPLVFDPSNPSIIYAGKVGSGVVKGTVKQAASINSILPLLLLEE